MYILYGYIPVNYHKNWHCFKPRIKTKEDIPCFADGPSSSIWLVPGTYKEN